jgi:hypothetical protein
MNRTHPLGIQTHDRPMGYREIRGLRGDSPAGPPLACCGGLPEEKMDCMQLVRQLELANEHSGRYAVGVDIEQQFGIAVNLVVHQIEFG